MEFGVSQYIQSVFHSFHFADLEQKAFSHLRDKKQDESTRKELENGEREYFYPKK